jgi:FimV-like protein
MELAEEFMALGDAQGARPLAERVQALATGELQQRARSLLQRLEARPH